jgi:hypothetical protein
MEDSTLTIRVYKGRKKEWRWLLIYNSNGKTGAASAEGDL